MRLTRVTGLPKTPPRPHRSGISTLNDLARRPQLAAGAESFLHIFSNCLSQHAAQPLIAHDETTQATFCTLIGELPMTLLIIAKRLFLKLLPASVLSSTLLISMFCQSCMAQTVNSHRLDTTVQLNETGDAKTKPGLSMPLQPHSVLRQEMKDRAVEKTDHREEKLQRKKHASKRTRRNRPRRIKTMRKRIQERRCQRIQLRRIKTKRNRIQTDKGQRKQKEHQANSIEMKILFFPKKATL